MLSGPAVASSDVRNTGDAFGEITDYGPRTAGGRRAPRRTRGQRSMTAEPAFRHVAADFLGVPYSQLTDASLLSVLLIA